MYKRRGAFMMVLSVVLLGCGGGSEGSADAPSDSSSGSGATTTSVVIVADTSPAAVPTTEPPATMPPSTDAPPVTEMIDMNDLSACAATKWIMVADQMEDLFTDTAIGSVPGASIVVEGEGLLDLRADGTYTYTPGFTAIFTVADQSATGEWSGSATGTWSVVGDRLTMAQTTNDVAGSLSFLGQTMPLPNAGALDGEGRIVECTPATLEVELVTPIGTLSHTYVIA